MLYLCPHCGCKLPLALRDGLSYCLRCERVFDTSDCNILLAAAWHVRREGFDSHQLQWRLGLTDSFADLVYGCVGDGGQSHDEFLRHIKNVTTEGRVRVDSVVAA